MTNEGVLAITSAFALHEVELPEPPGLQAKLRVLPIDEAMRKGMVRGDLRAAALKAAGENVDAGDVGDEQLRVGLQAGDIQLCEMVRALRIGPDAEWEPVRMTPETFEDQLPSKTIAALRDIAENRKTPAMVTALVRRMRGEISEDEAVRIVEDETPKLASTWSSFRREPRGTGPRDDGQGVGEEPERGPENQ